MTTNAHTPTPWKFIFGPRHSPDECDISIVGDIFVLSHIDGPNYAHCAANAAFIVRAVNSIDELAEASADYARLIQVESFDRNDIAVHAAYERLRAAINAAKGA